MRPMVVADTVAMVKAAMALFLMVFMDLLLRVGERFVPARLMR